LPNRELEIVGYGPDDYILEEISRVTIKDPILVSNDIMLRIKAKQRNIAAEPYKAMIPFKAESQRYTGFIDKDKDELVTNCFY
jgi:predicted ribonuclease YlaK